MLTIDEQLDQALARITHFESDTQASANLLAEASAKLDGLTAQITELNAERERLAADLQATRTSLDSIGKSKADSDTRLAELVARNTDLESREQDIEKRALRRSAEIVAATGTSAPAPVTPKGDRQTDDLVARFRAISDPKAQTVFWRSLTAQQQALILNSPVTHK